MGTFGVLGGRNLRVLETTRSAACCGVLLTKQLFEVDTAAANNICKRYNLLGFTL